MAYSLSLNKDSELEGEADGAIELIARAQRADGYLNTYFTIREPGKEFTNLREGHELYTAGHMMEAACAYYENTGKDRFLKRNPTTSVVALDGDKVVGAILCGSDGRQGEGNRA